MIRIMLIHHPPHKGGARRLRQLTDGPRLRQTLARRGCEAVLHGHNHRASIASVPGPDRPIPVIGAPSASARPNRTHLPGWWLVEIDEKARPEAAVRPALRRYDVARARFAEYGARSPRDLSAIVLGIRSDRGLRGKLSGSQNRSRRARERRELFELSLVWRVLDYWRSDARRFVTKRTKADAFLASSSFATRRDARRRRRLLAASLARAQDGLEKVKLGSLRFVSSGAVFIALERGYFKDEGLDDRPHLLRRRSADRGRDGVGRPRSWRHGLHRRLLQSRRQRRAEDHRGPGEGGEGL